MNTAMISDRLFVYGTLMRGFDHPMARLLAANADFIGDAHCRGQLYLVKHYPGLVLSDDPADVVHGELYRLRARDEMLHEFDMYEACGEGFPQPTEYLRQMLAAEIRTYQMEKRYFHKAGHIVWALLSVSLVQDERGRGYQ